MEKSDIAEFFDGRSVFVTGGTGLMGKVLIWKLLKSCPGIKTIYTLIRPKRNKSELMRYQEIIKAPVSTVNDDYGVAQTKNMEPEHRGATKVKKNYVYAKCTLSKIGMVAL